MGNFLRLCILCVLITNCAPEYVSDTRILAKGILVDGYGTPISNKKVNIYARNFPGFSGDNQSSYLLGSNTTNTDGRFGVVALLVLDEDLYISIDGGSGYIDYLYKSNTGNYVPPSLSYDLDTVTLRKKATVNFSISRISMIGTSLSYSFSYQSPNCTQVFEDGILVPEFSNCYSEQMRNGNLDDDTPDISNHFESTLGSTVIFSYSINGGPTLTESFVINQTSLVYEFIY